MRQASPLVWLSLSMPGPFESVFGPGLDEESSLQAVKAIAKPKAAIIVIIFFIVYSVVLIKI